MFVLRTFDEAQKRAQTQRRSSRVQAIRCGLSSIVVATLATLPIASHAVDGCLVMLCLAAPSWRSVPQCVDPVRQLLHDLAHGHPFPSCPSAGAGNSASNRSADAPVFCPPQYTTALLLECGVAYSCAYAGAIEVSVDGSLWSRTWWSWDGDSVTDYSTAARLALGSWDSRFDADYAAWRASHPEPVPVDTAP
jgi:hypothetical protein